MFHLARQRCFGEHMAVETMVGQFVCSEEKLLNMLSNGCFQDYPNNIVQKDSTSIKALAESQKFLDVQFINMHVMQPLNKGLLKTLAWDVEQRVLYNNPT